MGETHIAVTVSAPIPVQAAGCCGGDCCGGAVSSIQQGGEINITQAVQQHYSAIARDVLSGARAHCCGDDCCGSTTGDTISQDLYRVDELEGLPLKAALA